MSAKAPLGLPSIPAPLKSVLPYLQRAEEVKVQEPIVAYWCAYYAAQLGIGLRTKDAESRSVLLALLGFLEQMKSGIGHADAVDVDAVGAACVENFALKVFSVADNEDRNGRATRLTAKKFLAAANFLEVLKTFTNADLPEANTEKIKYSKWKAADIAKAFREGRKPSPGPPGFSEEQEIENQLLGMQHQALDSLDLPSVPRPPLSPEHPSSSPKAPSTQATYDEGWSTIVAPNASILDPASIPESSTPRRSNSGTSLTRPSVSGSLKRGAYVSEELEGKRTPSPTLPSPKPRSPTRSASNSKRPSPTRQGRTPSPGSDKKVHFTPSVVGGSVSSVSQPGSPDHSQTDFQPKRSPRSTGPALPPSLPPLPPPPPPSLPNISGPSPYRLSPSARSPPPHQYSLPPAPPPAPKRVQLTPAVILKAQKHCRLASSALDYEDAATAKRELRAALALLGD